MSIKTGPHGKVSAWSDESHFLFHRMDGQVRVRVLPWEHMVPGYIMGRSQAGGGSVIFSGMFCWEDEREDISL